MRYRDIIHRKLQKNYQQRETVTEYLVNSRIFSYKLSDQSPINILSTIEKTHKQLKDLTRS